MKKTTSKNKTALLVGAVVYDTLFGLSSSIAEQVMIVDGKAGRQNMLFTAQDKQVYLGGPSGNVAYGLSLLKHKPLLASIAGKDFGEYGSRLKTLGVLSRVATVSDGYTAMFYGMTDTKGEQVGVFQGNSYHGKLKQFPLSKLLKKNDWSTIGVGLFSMGTAQSITRDIKEFRAHAKKDAIAILDPGPMLVVDFTSSMLLQAVRSADILIVNESEAHFMKNSLGVTHESLWKAGLHYLIVTHNEKGSALHTREGVTYVKAVPVKKVVDPTGAGDAFRAGLVHGLLSGMTLVQSMEIGSRLGAKCVATKGGQTYKI